MQVGEAGDGIMSEMQACHPGHSGTKCLDGVSLEICQS